jgi:hypothetical protein
LSKAQPSPVVDLLLNIIFVSETGRAPTIKNNGFARHCNRGFGFATGMQPLTGFPLITAALWSQIKEGQIMMVEFYKHGGQAPENFDIFMHGDGRMSFDHRKPKKGFVRVIVELSCERPNSYQAKAMFDLISKHKVCTVAFYNFEG